MVVQSESFDFLPVFNERMESALDIVASCWNQL